jgi:hypothetical protein
MFSTDKKIFFMNVCGWLKLKLIEPKDTEPLGMEGSLWFLLSVYDFHTIRR